MRAGRFVCVGLPILLTIAAIVATMIATLSGVAHNRLYLFSVDLKDLEIDRANLDNIVDNLNIDIDIPGLDRRQQQDGITAGDLGLGESYDVTLWGYCENKKNGDRKCTKSEFDWANKRLKKDFIDDLGSAADVNIDLPDEIDDALKIFSTGIKYTEIAYIVSLVALGLELFIGIFSNFTRIISCLTYLIAIIAMLITIAAGALATAMAAIVVGAIEGSNNFYGAHARINGSYLAVIWIGAAFAIVASLFWLFTVCCCKPEHRSNKKNRGSTDGEKLLPQGSYQRIGNDFEMGHGANQYPSQTSYAPSFNRPPSHHARSDMAYEPYSHRA